MGGFRPVSARGGFARVGVALLLSVLTAGLAAVAVSRTSAGGMLENLVTGHRPGSAVHVGGPRLTAASRGPAITVDPARQAAEQAVVAPAARPSLLLIPKLGVDAVVEAVGVNSDGTMGVPSQPSHVAWYQLGVTPGDPGNALIDGHLNWYGQPCTVFCHLANLRHGDQVNIVRVDGSELTFMVDSVRSYPWNAQTGSLVSATGAPSLSLVTCSGAWDQQRQTYLNRLVVHATLVPTAPSQTPGDEGG